MTASSRRSAYSLFEVVIVCAILVVVAAISFPSLRAMYGSYKMTGAVDSVRAAWALARSKAIEQGRPYRFAVESDGVHFRVAPDNPEYWSGSTPSGDPQGPGFVKQESLPAGVRFTVNGDPSSPPPPEVLSNSNPQGGGGNWSTAVVFQPDGTAREDVKILFQIQGARPTFVHLRGLTGTATVETVQP